MTSSKKQERRQGRLEFLGPVFSSNTIGSIPETYRKVLLVLITASALLYLIGYND